MNICIISNLKDVGYGESTRPYYLSIELAKHGHKIMHLCEKKSAFVNGINYISIKRFQSYPSLIIRIIYFFRLWVTIKIFKPDLIYVHQFNNARWALATKVLPKVPLIFDAHTSVYFEIKTFGAEAEKLKYIRGIEEQICIDSDYIIAASHSTKDILTSEYNLSQNKISVVENATSIPPIPKPYETHNSKFICAATLPFDGFQSNEMALDFLLRVAENMIEISADVEFHVLGGGSKPIPATPNIIYSGYVPDLKSYLLNSDVCLVPYPDKAVCGGIRNKVCDYLSLGKAIVSTEEGMRGFMDLKKDQHYIEANTVDEFVEAIMNLRSDLKLRKNLELNALAKGANYQWSLRGIELNKIFNSLRRKES